MATWTQKSPTGTTSTRRKWNLEDRASLNNLKYHIAAEGCSEVQYDLARQLLDTKIEQNNGSSSHSEQAVQWLLSAAVQGHEPSAKLLQECYALRRGITDENEAEVRCCLSLTPGERAARKAARELFACLSNGGEHITPKKLERKMREIYKMQKRRRRRNNSNSTSEEDTEDEPNESCAEPLENVYSVENGHVHLRQRRAQRAHLNVNPAQQQQNITEENLVSAAVNYSAGRMPSVSDALTLSVPHPASLDHVPCFHRLLFHPVIFFTLLYHRLINFVSALPASIPPSIRLSTLLLVYWLVSNEHLTVFLPICFYYICLTIMLWSTCKMLKSKHDFIDFRIWSGLFLSYGDNNIEADISENRFLKNNMKPYLYFFCAFVCNLVVYPLIASEWLPHSEITIIACMFVFVTLLTFMYASERGAPDWIILVSFGVNVLAKYPYEMDEVVTTGWRFLDLKVPTFCSFVIGNGIEFCLNCRTALYLLIPVCLVHLAKRSRWHGTYKHLIPHCVTLSWLQLGITTSRSATMFGVLRGTLGLAGTLLFLPLFGIVSLMIPVFLAIEWIGLTDPRIRLGTTVGAAALALIGSCLLALNRWTRKYITTLQVVICIIAASLLTLPYMTSNFKDNSRFVNIIGSEKRPSVISTTPGDDLHAHTMHTDLLTWHNFYALCGPSSWEQQNRIKAQLRCSHLNGMSVLWEGTVAHVQISRVFNMRADYIEKYLPRWLGNIIKCVYGENALRPNVCDAHTDPLCPDLQRILKENGMENTCSLYKWNNYEYEVLVKMSSGLLSKGSDVMLRATHKFGNFTNRLASGDQVQFYGTLLNSRILPNGLREDFIMGTSQAHVQLTAIKCTLCKDKDMSAVTLERPTKSPVDARMRDLMRGIKYLLNVLLNPLITFK